MSHYVRTKLLLILLSTIWIRVLLFCNLFLYIGNNSTNKLVDLDSSQILSFTILFRILFAINPNQTPTYYFTYFKSIYIVFLSNIIKFHFMVLYCQFYGWEKLIQAHSAYVMQIIFLRAYVAFKLPKPNYAI